MAFELNLRIGRNREERRSMPPEEEKNSKSYRQNS
jgi:hypothetical protein